MTVEIQTLTHFGDGKKERVARNISIDMEQVKFLPLLIICVQTATGFIWNSSTKSISVCVGNTISLDWVYTIESGEFHQGTSWNKFDEAGALVTLANYFGGFLPEPAYVGRLTNTGNAGIQISNATSSDKGTYTVTVALTAGLTYIRITKVHVHEIANALCIPTCDSSWKCQIPQACPVQNYIEAVWTVDGFKYPNVFQCPPNNYNKPYNVCAEGDAVTSCYSESPLCRKENVCRDPPQCKLGLGLGLGLGIPIVISIIFVVAIFKYRDDKTKPEQTGYNHAFYLGLVHCMGIGITFQVGWIIYGILISICTISFELGTGLGLGLGLGLGSVIPWVSTIIIGVIFVFSSQEITNRVELGKGMLTGLLSATVIGTILVHLKYVKGKPEQTGYSDEYFCGLVCSVYLGLSLQYAWIVCASLIYTCTTSCEHLVGNGLFCFFIWVSIIIYALIRVFSSKDNPNRVEYEKGILTVLLSATVIGIILVHLKYDKLKPQQTGKKSEQVPLNTIGLLSNTTNSGAGNPFE